MDQMILTRTKGAIFFGVPSGSRRLQMKPRWAYETKTTPKVTVCLLGYYLL